LTVAAMDRNALALYLTFPLANLAASLCTALLAIVAGGPRLRAATAAYFFWVFLLDNAPNRGGYKLLWDLKITQWLRDAPFWRWAANYFPVTMDATSKLPPSDGPYIFVCHPHGIFGISPMTNFGTNATKFSQLFPGVPVHLLGHSVIFKIPFFREWCLAHGHGSVDKKTCLTLLRKRHSIALAPGGAKESLECVPNTMRLILQKRRGFAKLALQTGAALVPVLGFGENELYKTVQFKKGTWCRRVQEALQARLGFALPLFCGRLWMPLLPRRSPVFTVVGAPVRFKASSSSQSSEHVIAEPTDGQIAELHQQYCDALQGLFETHKSKYGAADVQLQFV